MKLFSFLTIALFFSNAVLAQEASVDKKKSKHKKSGAEPVEVVFDMDCEPSDLTTQEKVFMTAGLQTAFDDTNPGHKYSSTFAYLDDIVDDDVAKTGELRGRRLRFRRSNWWIGYGCRWCIDDDNFMVADGVPLSMLANKRVLKAWAKSFESIMENSDFACLQSVSKVKIDLPEGGVAAGYEEGEAVADRV